MSKRKGPGFDDKRARIASLFCFYRLSFIITITRAAACTCNMKSPKKISRYAVADSTYFLFLAKFEQTLQTSTNFCAKKGSVIHEEACVFLGLKSGFCFISAISTGFPKNNKKYQSKTKIKNSPSYTAC